LNKPVGIRALLADPHFFGKKESALLFFLLTFVALYGRIEKIDHLLRRYDAQGRKERK
jgi:hypothetical protein